MANCKDCVHFEICDGTSFDENFEEGTYTGGVEKECEYFKDRSKFVDLPCEVGNTVYYLKTLMDGKGTIVIEKDIVKQISINSYGVFLVISYCHGLNAANLGKTVFLTPEEAEKALEERKQNDNR